MKKKKTAMIKRVFCFLGIIAIIVMAGIMTYSYKINSLSKTGSKIADIHETESVATDISQIQETLRPSIVQITCGDLTGSGIIWMITDSEVLLITNKHVLLDADSCDVTFYQGEYYQGRVAYLSGTHDVGLAVVDTQEMDLEDLDNLKAVSWDEETADSIQVGDEIYIYGSADYIAADFLTAEILAQQTYVDAYQDNMLIGRLNRSDYGTLGIENLKNGMSGSGIFTTGGKLIGILSSGDDTGQFAAVTLDAILDDSQTWQYADNMQP